MQIYLDMVIFSLQKGGGISILWKELVERFKKNRLDFFCILLKKWRGNNLSDVCKDGVNIIEGKNIIPLNFLRCLPIKIKLTSKAIVHSSYYRFSLSSHAINVITVYDFTTNFYGKFGLKKWLHIWQKAYAIKKADGLICISESTKHDLLTMYPSIKAEKIKVIYCGVSDDYFPLTNGNNVASKYIVFVGGRGGYKHFDFVIRLLTRTNYHLTIVGGGALSAYEKELLNKYLYGRYNHISWASNSELNEIYNQSFCLLYPSKYEGFGIPIAEAMKAGCPVLAYNASSIPEAAGAAGLLHNDYEYESWIDSLNKLSDYEHRNKVISDGLAHAETFTWDKMYNETIAFYNELWESVL